MSGLGNVDAKPVCLGADELFGGLLQRVTQRHDDYCLGEWAKRLEGTHLAIPTAGLTGWHYGTERWPAAAFFRYQIADLSPIVVPPP